MQATDSETSDKIAIENSGVALIGLSKSAYIVLIAMVPLMAGVFSAKPANSESSEIDLSYVKVSLDVLPLIFSIIIYGVLMRACRCLSIVEQFIDHGVMVQRIEIKTRTAIKLMILTHEWPFNPFVDFTRYSEVKTLTDGQIKSIKFRIELSYLPFVASYVLCLYYLARFSPWPHLLVIWIMFVGYLMYDDMLKNYGELAGRIASQVIQDERLESIYLRTKERMKLLIFFLFVVAFVWIVYSVLAQPANGERLICA